MNKMTLKMTTLATVLVIVTTGQTIEDHTPVPASPFAMAPNPPGPNYSEQDSSQIHHRQATGMDLSTKQTWLQPFNQSPAKMSSDWPELGIKTLPDLASDAFPDNQSLAGTPAPPVPLLNTTQYPYSSIVKMVMRFTVNGIDYDYQCSGFMASTFHVVTAGHCIYNFDPNGDGFTNDQKWADAVWVFPGQTDWVEPVQCGTAYCGDWPYGVARATALRSYSGWSVNQDLNHDWGVITVDRHVGVYTGWMGRSTDLADSLNYSGYPGQQPFVPAGVNVQYWGYGQENLVGSNSLVFELFAAIYGGHSGGPVWKFVNNDRFVVGIISNGNRIDVANNVRLTTGKRNDLNGWIAEDINIRPPFALGELIENVYDGFPHKSLNKDVVGHGELLTVDHSVQNIGFADISRNISITLVASEDERIDDQDIILDQVGTSDDINANTTRNWSTTFTIPDWLPAGEYTLGLLYQTLGEYPGDLNCANTACTNKIAIANQPVTVEVCPSDFKEDDNTLATATTTTSGNSRLHSICTLGDVDYVQFTIDGDEPVTGTFETKGPAGDTLLSLLNHAGQVIAIDDDSGQNQFSKITRHCLPPGTYYLKVEEDGNNATIDRYDLKGQLSVCENLIFRNTFEATINWP